MNFKDQIEENLTFGVKFRILLNLGAKVQLRGLRLAQRGKQGLKVPFPSSESQSRKFDFSSSLCTIHGGAYRQPSKSPLSTCANHLKRGLYYDPALKNSSQDNICKPHTTLEISGSCTCSYDFKW